MNKVANTIDSIGKKTAETVKAERCDYIGEDGLLVCGNCNTRKQGRYEMPWGTVTPACLCECEKERREMEDLKARQNGLIFLYRNDCFSGDKFKKMRNWTFAGDDGANKKISTVSRNYVENFDKMTEDGKGLLLYGNVGTGKSFAAACIANALIDRCIPVIMTNFMTIRNDLQESFEGRSKYIERLTDIPLLILDDLSAESKTEYMQEIVYNVVDSRYRAGKPLIVTTNLTGDELKAPADLTNQRTFSRLFEMCIPIEVAGNDRRREYLIEAHKEYKDVLGY